MSTVHNTTSFIIELDGNPLPDDLGLMSVEVDENLHLPDLFRATFRDEERTAITRMNARIGSRFTVSVLRDSDDKSILLMKGEITAIEAEIYAGQSLTLLRGYDESHRLLTGRVTASYLDCSYSDIAARVAKRQRLKVGKITSTGPTFDHVAQRHENDWEFLWRLAREIGFEVAVRDGALDFSAPNEDQGSAAPAELGTDDSLALVVGDNVVSLRASVTAAEQPVKVEIRSWDPANKAAIVAEARPKTTAAKNGIEPSDMSCLYPDSKAVSATGAFAGDQEAGQAADAYADEVAARSASVEGTARGNPKLRAGAFVSLSLAGEPFDGIYLVNEARHIYDPGDGYTTGFVIGGRTQRSLLALTRGDLSGATFDGVVPAIVESTEDPLSQARVQLRLPWLEDNYVTSWARVCYLGAGTERGWLVPPEVGDEVLVAFEHGNLTRPYVLGGLYNGVDGPGPHVAKTFDGTTNAVNRRTFTSRLGHQLVFDDSQGGGGITLSTKDGHVTIRLDAHEKSLDISTDGPLSVTATGDLVLESRSNVIVRAGGEVKVAGTMIHLN